MYPGYSTATIKRILKSKAVTTKIRQLSLARLNDIEGVRELSDAEKVKKLRVLEVQLHEMAFKAADSMVAKMDSFVLPSFCLHLADMLCTSVGFPFFVSLEPPSTSQPFTQQPLADC